MGSRFDAEDITRRSREIKVDQATWKSAEAAGSTLEPLRRLEENSEFGRPHVYDQEVLAAVEAAQRSGSTKVEVVDLPEKYLEDAGALAQKRAACAAHRLAEILSEDVK